MNTRTVGMMLTLVLVALVALAPVAQGSEEWEREFEVESGQKIELEMKHGGSLEVEGWDRDLVRIQCTEERNGIDAYEIEVTETRSGLRFVAELEDRRINSTNLKVKLMVPREFDIESESGGGEVSITGVTGDFRGRSAGGEITLTNVTGKANLTTGGGFITIEDSDLDGRVRSGGGGGVMRNVTGNVKATSGGGIVSYENVRDKQGDFRAPGGLSAEGTTAGTVMYASAGGSIDLDEAPEGAIVQTGGGDIDIRRASRYVQAQTGGGDVEIEIEDGHVVARTGAGDIEVMVAGGLGDSRDGVDLRTGHGNITLVVPAGASLEFDVDLAYTRNSSRDFEIVSDLDLEIEHTQEWRRENGSNHWKHIYGTGTINGGEHRVVIHGVNGNIRIKTK